MHRHHSSPAAARKLEIRTLAAAVAVTFAAGAFANPVGPTVAAGSASFTAAGSTLTVVNTPGTIINWQQFNIGQNEITKFIQQSNQSTVLNRITGQDPSRIFGTLQSNGRVFLVNPNGILFGQNAVIDVFGLVASNLNIANADFVAGRFSFGGGGAGAVVNQGAITTPVGGSVYLIGSDVANQGLITSPKGEVMLAAGNSVNLADTGTPNVSVTLNASGNKAVNLGRVTAEGGRIDIYGALIEQQGVLRADSASVDAQGRIVLKATQAATASGEISATNGVGSGGTVRVLGEEVALTETARIDVSGAQGGGTALIGGDWQGANAAVTNAKTTRVAAGATIKADATDAGNGGKVVVWSDDETLFGGLVYARGGPNGGDGGGVETSGHRLGVAGMVDTTALRGKAGSWLLDPAVGCVADTASLCPAGADVMSTTFVEQALALNSQVTYQADDYVKFATTGTWILSSSVPGTGKLFLSAPYVHLAGSLDASTNNKTIDVFVNATSGATSATYPSKTGVIDIDAGKMLHTPGMVNLSASKTVNLPGDIDLRTPALSIWTNDYFSFQPSEMTSVPQVGNFQVTAPYLALGGLATVGAGYARSFGSSATYPSKSGTMDLLPGLNWSVFGHVHLEAEQRMVLAADAKFSTASSSTFATVRLASPVVENGGASFALNNVGLAANSLVGAPLSVNAESIELNARGGNLYLGTDTCAAPDVCTSDPARFFAGTYNHINAYAYRDGTKPSSGNLYVTGPFNHRNKHMWLSAAGAIQVDSPITSTGSIDFYSGNLWGDSVAANVSRDIVVNQPVSARFIRAQTHGGALRLNATLTATDAIHVVLSPYCISGGIDCASPLQAGFVNKAGATALSAAEWHIANLNGTAQVDLGGLSASGPLTLAEAQAKSSPVAAAATQPGYANGAFYLSGSGKPAITFAGIYSGTFDGSVSGTWTLTVSSGGAITGKTVSTSGTVATLSGTATSSGELSFTTGAVSTGETFSGTYNAATGVLSGTWKNPASGASGRFSNAATSPDAVASPDAVTQKSVAQAVADTCATNAALCASNQQQQATAAAVDATAEAGSAGKGKLTVDEKLKDAKKSDEKKVAEEKKQPDDKKPAEQKKAEVAKQKQEAKAAEERKSPAELKQEARQAQAEAKKVEAEAKQAQAEAKKVEAEAKQAASVAKKAETEGKKAEAEARKAETEIKAAKAPDRKAAAEARKSEAEAKKADVEAKKIEADAKQAQAASKKTEAQAKQAAHDAKQAEAEHKLALADAKEAKSPEAKAVAQGKAAEKQAEATRKKAEGDVKQAQADEHKAAAAQKKVEAEAKQAEHDAKRAEAGAKKAEADAARAKQAGKTDEERKALAQKAEHEKQAEAGHKQAEAKQAEANARKAEHEKLAGARRSEAAKAFARTAVAALMPDRLAHMAALRHEYKTELLKPALTILEQNPKAADMPTCGAGAGEACIPVKAAAAETAKAVRVAASPKPTLSFVPQIERKVAVLVGINNYADKSIPALESAVPDAEAVGRMMAEKLGYEVRIVRDATKADIVKAINGVGREVGPNDSVAIYYAGHGYLSEKANMGYWIPADSSVKNPSNWISNDDIARLLQQIPAKQVMLVSDSCYSGALTREGKVAAAVPGIEAILDKRSVTVMSSGGEEPVSDEGKEGHSIFAWSLMDALKKVDRYEPGAKLFDNVKRTVVEEFPQVPQYGAATSAGHAAGGDYLLEVRSYK